MFWYHCLEVDALQNYLILNQASYQLWHFKYLKLITVC